MKRLVHVVALGVLVVACSSSSSSSSPAADAGADGAADDAGSGGSQCTAARDTALGPIDRVSTGSVSIVSTDGATRVLYVDASAGGANRDKSYPRVYVNLETGTRVDVTDEGALASTDWDLSLKRTVIYTNGGDGGPGSGGAQLVAKTFTAVTADDATNVAKETFFDADCNAHVDQAGFLVTSFSPAWYDYDVSTNKLVPKDVTFIVAGATGKRYKVAITSWTGKPDGTEGTTTNPGTGYYLLKVASL